jgi:hypothetical protein
MSPKTIINQNNNGWQSNEEFYDYRIAELAAAFKRNHPVNEKRATSLKIASYTMFIGVLCQVFVLIYLTI